MDIFGIGALEILFILVIALIVLGPEDLEKTGKAIGRFLRKIVTSDNWHVFQETSKDIRNLPNRLIREAGLEEMQEDLNSIGLDKIDITGDINKGVRELRDDINSWVTPQPPEKQLESENNQQPEPEGQDQENDQDQKGENN